MLNPGKAVRHQRLVLNMFCGAPCMALLACPVQDAKPKLCWLLGDSQTSSFLDLVKKVNSMISPMTATALEKQLKVLSSLHKKLDEMALPKETDLSMSATEFFNAFSSAKLEQMRRVRSELKDAVAKYEELLAVAGAEKPPVVTKAHGLLEIVKLQTIKWGLVSFLTNSEIAADNVRGHTLRTKLKGIWQLHLLDASVTSYLGEAMGEQIATLTGKHFKSAFWPPVFQQPAGAVDAKVADTGDVPGSVSMAASCKRPRVDNGASSAGLKKDLPSALEPVGKETLADTVTEGESVSASEGKPARTDVSKRSAPASAAASARAKRTKGAAGRRQL